ncbi:hypothetical protein [Actinokineospora fastidiosa]|uniref:Uncharacterized protein n=1 Tax=Actinokineospora fastidiosa TaxID=1816 RepID=A0A918L715_9PSEU|nr:hypothetical protein [Actinokineospora fastidiosa]GGS14208.1 hypothetical protein GCM10010171_02600 [Actinokineospora fastidiosa]
MRTLLAWLLGLAGVVAVGYGAFTPWHDGIAGTSVPIADLFTGVHDERAGLVTSIAVLTLLGAAIVAAGLLLSGIVLRAGAALLLLTVLVWTVQYGGVDGLQVGYWNSVFGTLLVMVAATIKG